MATALSLVRSTRSDRLLEFARADTAGAEVHGLPARIGLDVDLLKVRQPTPLGEVVRVADPVPGDGFLVAAETFFGHSGRIIPDSGPVGKGRGNGGQQGDRTAGRLPALPKRPPYQVDYEAFIAFCSGLTLVKPAVGREDWTRKPASVN